MAGYGGENNRYWPLSTPSFAEWSLLNLRVAPFGKRHLPIELCRLDLSIEGYKCGNYY
jgi:hypothetical protein